MTSGLPLTIYKAGYNCGNLCQIGRKLPFLAIFTPESPFSLASWHIALQFIALVAWAGTGMFAQVFRLVLIDLGGIILFQQVLSTFTPASQLAIVISTLATAALFSPLRKRIQYGIDRRFYRNRHDAEKILAAFSASLRDQVDLDQLQERLLLVIEECMHPEWVFLWLAKPESEAGVSRNDIQE